MQTKKERLKYVKTLSTKNPQQKGFEFFCKDNNFLLV